MKIPVGDRPGQILGIENQVDFICWQARVLSDAQLELTRALSLPTFRYGEWTLLKRCTLIIAAGVIEQVMYPVYPSTADVPLVLAWLRERR